MSTSEHRKAGRPKGRVLSRALIVETALRLLDEHGADGFGMRDVAAALDVRVSSLYNHVSGKDDLIIGLREHVGALLGTDSFDSSPWDEALQDWARRYHHTFASHPPTIALLAVLPLAPDSTLAVTYDAIVATLEREGFSGERALSIIVALESLILGSALDAAAPQDMLDPGPRADVPAFSRAYARRSVQAQRTGATPAEMAFETGLELFMAGLRAEHAGLH